MDRVPEAIRKRNKLSVEKRAAWRARYARLANAIKQQKRKRSEDPHNAQIQIELEGLQTLAQIMMLERTMITWDLRDSAYAWV